MCKLDFKGISTLPLDPHHEGAHREYHPQHVHVIWKTFSVKLISQEEDPTWSEIITWSIFPVFTLSTCSYHRLPGRIVDLAIMDQRCIFLATTAGNLTTSRVWKKQHIPEVRHICRSSLAAWGQLLLRSAAFSSERDIYQPLRNI